MNYNIGAGQTVIEGYKNKDWGDDICPHDEMVDNIYTSHFIEYFDEAEAMKMLQIWNMKMIPGSTLHIAVPDFEGIVTVWQEEGIILSGPLYGKMEVDGQTIYHKSCYCYPKLRDYLLAAGFRKIKRHYDLKDWPNIDDCSRAMFQGLPISLNLSAIK